ncbi:MAG: LacI family DNA-binding transcriptional regulator [Bacteroidota bacterium]
MNQHRITIKDLARELGISKSTVSRALRGHPNVKKETRDAVKALAEKLDYQPDQVALSLVHRRTFTIGVVVPNISFPYFSHALSAAEEVATAAGYQIILCQSQESFDTEKKVIQNLVSNRIDGLLLSISGETQDFEHIHNLRRKGVPVVLFDRVFGHGTFPQVLVDNFEAAYKVTKHLIEQGYRRIAHLAGPQRLLVSQQRLQGYLEALDEAGIEEDEALIVEKGFRREHGKQAVEQLLALPDPPEALLAVSDSAAIGAKIALEEKGLKVPNDMALASFNNEAYTEFVEPSITTVSFPMREMGAEAAKMLLAQLDSQEEKPEPEQLILSTELIIRKSSLNVQ